MIRIFVILNMLGLTFASFSSAQEQLLPEFVLQNGHISNIITMAFSPDGKLLASGSYLGNIKLWEVASGKLIRTIKGHPMSAKTLVFSQDGKILISSGGQNYDSIDSNIKLWDVASGEQVRSLGERIAAVDVIAYSPNGLTLASDNSDHPQNLATFVHSKAIFNKSPQQHTINLWDIATGNIIRSLSSHTGHIESIMFSPDGKILASGSEDKTIKLWSVATGKPIHILKKHSSTISALAFSSDGKLLASGSWDKTIKLWNVASGKQIRTLKGHSHVILSLKFASDGKALLSVSSDNTIKHWDVASGKPINNFPGYSDIKVVALSADGKTVATAGMDKTIKLWNAIDGKPILTIKKGHSSIVSNVSFTNDGKTLTSANWDNTIKLWDTSSGRLKNSISRQYSHDEDITLAMLASSFDRGQIMPLDFTSRSPFINFKSNIYTPDGQSKIYNKDKNTVIWDIATEKIVRNFEGIFGSLSQNGEVLATITQDNEIKLWHIATGEHIRTFERHSEPIGIVHFSPDNRILISRNGAIITVWDSFAGKPLHTLDGRTARRREYDAIPSRSRRNRRSHTRSTRDSFQNPPTNFDVAFSPDGKTLAVGGDDLKIWDVHTGKLIHILEGHSSLWPTIDAIEFSPDGEMVASGNSEGMVRLWNVKTGELIHDLSDHSKHIKEIVFTPNGKFLYSRSADGFVKIWSIEPGQLLQTLGVPFDYMIYHRFEIDGKITESGDVLSSALQGVINGVENRQRVLVSEWETRSILYSPIDEKYKGAYTGKIYATTSTLSGKTLVFGRGKQIEFRNAITGRLIGTIENRGNSDEGLAYALAVSPDNKIVAAGNSNGTVRLWDLATGKLKQDFKAHPQAVCGLAFSPDGKTLASGSSDMTVKLWDVDSGNLIRVLKGHSRHVFALTFSPDGKILVSGSLDTSLRFWRVHDGSLLTEAYAVGEEDYIVYTPQGYFIASENAQDYASWRVGNEVYTFEQIGEQLFRPDLVARSIAGEDLPTPEIHLPTPKLEWQNRFTATTANQVEIVLRYQGANELNELLGLHNGKSIPIELPVGKKNTEIHFPLQLSEYNNTLRILAYDANQQKSNLLSIDFQYRKGRKGITGPGEEKITPPPPQLGEYGKKYAIVIGISDYKNLKKTATPESKLKDLKYAHKDAEAFTAFLQDSTRSGGGWEIKQFINEQATSGAVEKALTTVLMSASSKDLIFIFFSGHGRSHPAVPGEIYLLTHDFKPLHPRSGYDYSWLERLLEQSPCDHIIAFIDACHGSGVQSGLKGDERAAFDANLFGKKIKNLRRNRVILGSSSDWQSSYESDELQSGIFTYFLLKGLNGAAPERYSSPEIVNLGELYEFVAHEVQDRVKREHGELESQIPRIWETGEAPAYEFPMAIRRRYK